MRTVKCDVLFFSLLSTLKYINDESSLLKFSEFSSVNVYILAWKVFEIINDPEKNMVNVLKKNVVTFVLLKQY